MAMAQYAPEKYLETYVKQQQTNKTTLFKKNSMTMTIGDEAVLKKMDNTDYATQGELLGAIDAANNLLGTSAVIQIIDTLHDFWNATRSATTKDIKDAINYTVRKYILELNEGILTDEQKNIYTQILEKNGMPGLLLALTRVVGVPPVPLTDHSGIGSGGSSKVNSIGKLEPTAQVRYCELTDKNIPSFTHYLQKHSLNISFPLQKLHDDWANNPPNPDNKTFLDNLLTNRDVDTIRIVFPKDRGERQAFFNKTLECKKVGDFILKFLNYGMQVNRLAVCVDATAGKLFKFIPFKQVSQIIMPENIGDSALNPTDKENKGNDEDEYEDDDEDNTTIKKEHLFMSNDNGPGRKSLSIDNLFTSSNMRAGKSFFNIWYDEIPGRTFTRNDPACIRLNVQYTPAQGGTARTFITEFSTMRTGTPVSGPSVDTLAEMIKILFDAKPVPPAQLNVVNIIKKLREMDIKRQIDLRDMVIAMLHHPIDIDLIIALLLDLKRLGDYNQNRKAREYEKLHKIITHMTSGDILSNFAAKRSDDISDNINAKGGNGLNSSIKRGNELEITRYFKPFTRDPAQLQAAANEAASVVFDKLKDGLIATINTYKERISEIRQQKNNLLNIYKSLNTYVVEKIKAVAVVGIIDKIVYGNQIATIQKTQIGLMKLISNIDKSQKVVLDAITVPGMREAEGDQIQSTREQWKTDINEKIERLYGWIKNNDELYDKNPVIAKLMSGNQGDLGNLVEDVFNELLYKKNYIDLDKLDGDNVLEDKSDKTNTLYKLRNYVVNERDAVRKDAETNIEQARVQLYGFKAGLRELLLKFTELYNLNDNTEKNNILKPLFNTILNYIESLKNILIDSVRNTTEGGEYYVGVNDTNKSRVDKYISKQILDIKAITDKIKELYDTRNADAKSIISSYIDANKTNCVINTAFSIGVKVNGGGMKTIVGGVLNDEEKKELKKELLVRKLNDLSSRAQQAIACAYAEMYPDEMQDILIESIKKIELNPITEEEAEAEEAAKKAAAEAVHFVPRTPPFTIETYNNYSMTTLDEYDPIHANLFIIENHLKMMANPSAKTSDAAVDAAAAAAAAAELANLNINVRGRIAAINRALAQPQPSAALAPPPPAPPAPPASSFESSISVVASALASASASASPPPAPPASVSSSSSPPPSAPSISVVASASASSFLSPPPPPPPPSSAPSARLEDFIARTTPKYTTLLPANLTKKEMISIGLRRTIPRTSGLVPAYNELAVEFMALVKEGGEQGEVNEILELKEEIKKISPYLEEEEDADNADNADNADTEEEDAKKKEEYNQKQIELIIGLAYINDTNPYEYATPKHLNTPSTPGSTVKERLKSRFKEESVGASARRLDFASQNTQNM